MVWRDVGGSFFNYMAANLQLTGGVGEGQRNALADVKKVQGALNLAGCIVGMVDGSCGRKTGDAIRFFQQTNCGIRPDGFITPGQITDQRLAVIYLQRCNSTSAVLAVRGLVNGAEKLKVVQENVKGLVARFAVKFGAITINSGRRDLAKQADLMAGMTNSQLLALYPGAYTNDIVVLTPPRKAGDVFKILDDCYEDGPDPHPYISRHLQGRAVDISMGGWSPSDAQRAKAIARELGLVFKDETQEGISCFHVQQ